MPRMGFNMKMLVYLSGIFNWGILKYLIQLFLFKALAAFNIKLAKLLHFLEYWNICFWWKMHLYIQIHVYHTWSLCRMPWYSRRHIVISCRGNYLGTVKCAVRFKDDWFEGIGCHRLSLTYELVCYMPCECRLLKVMGPLLCKPYNEQLCQSCQTFGQEYHFVLICKAHSLQCLRQKYIVKYYTTYPCMGKFLVSGVLYATCGHHKSSHKYIFKWCTKAVKEEPTNRNFQSAKSRCELMLLP